jgi:hypothetical protein
LFSNNIYYTFTLQIHATLLRTNRRESSTKSRTKGGIIHLSPVTNDDVTNAIGELRILQCLDESCNEALLACCIEGAVTVAGLLEVVGLLDHSSCWTTRQWCGIGGIAEKQITFSKLFRGWNGGEHIRWGIANVVELRWEIVDGRGGDSKIHNTVIVVVLEGTPRRIDRKEEIVAANTVTLGVWVRKQPRLQQLIFTIAIIE